MQDIKFIKHLHSLCQYTSYKEKISIFKSYIPENISECKSYRIQTASQTTTPQEHFCNSAQLDSNHNNKYGFPTTSN